MAYGVCEKNNGVMTTGSGDKRRERGGIGAAATNALRMASERSGRRRRKRLDRSMAATWLKKKHGCHIASSAWRA